MHTFGLIFLAALLLTVMLRLWLAARHAAHVAANRGAVPAQFASVISLDAHQRAADYTCAKTRFAMLSVVVEAAIALAFTFGGGLQALHTLTAGWFEPGMLRSLALADALVAIPPGGGLAGSPVDLLPIPAVRSSPPERRSPSGTRGLR
ncbi:MAG: hypothetical protein ACO271_14725 [Burkholderiales bacterium]